MKEVGVSRDHRHGHVVPRPDGVKARCGGPALCASCCAELLALIAIDKARERTVTVRLKPKKP